MDCKFNDKCVHYDQYMFCNSKYNATEGCSANSADHIGDWEQCPWPSKQEVEPDGWDVFAEKYYSSIFDSNLSTIHFIQKHCILKPTDERIEKLWEQFKCSETVTLGINNGVETIWSIGKSRFIEAIKSLEE